MTRRPSDDRDRLVRSTVAGRIAPARLHAEPPALDDEGRLVLVPGGGGIALDVHVGDPVAGFVADHLMVGASIEDEAGVAAVAGPLHLLACLGNRVRDRGGRGIGVVAGKRGGLAPGFMPPQLVSVEAPATRLRELQPGDATVVESIGRGLTWPDHAGVAILNLSPTLLDELPLEEADGEIEIAVRATAPARWVGPGLGQDAWIGDVDIAGDGWLASVPDLRFGDLIALTDFDGRISRFPRRGHVAVGIVAHGPSPTPGHGVGITLILSGPDERLLVRLSEDASLAPALRTLGEEAVGTGTWAVAT